MPNTKLLARRQPRINRLATQPRLTHKTALPPYPSTLRILPQRLRTRQREDLATGMFRRRDDERGRVGGYVAGEDGGVDHEQVVRAVDLGVEIHDR
jgi:hypothetical protein